MTKPTQVYSADPGVAIGSVIPTVVKSFAGSPYVAYRLALREIKAEYSKSALGAFWSLADPLILALIFYKLQKVRVIDAGQIEIPYSVFIIFGLLLYQSYMDCALSTVGLFSRWQGLLTQLKVSPEALILSCIFRVYYQSTFRMVIMFAFAFYTGALSYGGFIFFIALFPILLVSGAATGVLLAPFNVIYSDVGRALTLILLVLRFASPVMYATEDRLPRLFNEMNPIAHLLDNMRSVATTGEFTSLYPLLIHAAIAGLLFFLGAILCRIGFYVLTDRL